MTSHIRMQPMQYMYSNLSVPLILYPGDCNLLAAHGGRCLLLTAGTVELKAGMHCRRVPMSCKYGVDASDTVLSLKVT